MALHVYLFVFRNLFAIDTKTILHALHLFIGAKCSYFRIANKHESKILNIMSPDQHCIIMLNFFSTRRSTSKSAYIVNYTKLIYTRQT